MMTCCSKASLVASMFAYQGLPLPHLVLLPYSAGKLCEAGAVSLLVPSQLQQAKTQIALQV